MTNSSALKKTNTAVVKTPMVFCRRLLRWSPMISCLLMMSIMQIKTMGSKMALSTWVQMVIWMSGAWGSKMIVTAMPMISVIKT